MGDHIHHRGYLEELWKYVEDRGNRGKKTQPLSMYGTLRRIKMFLISLTNGRTLLYTALRQAHHMKGGYHVVGES